MLEFVTGNKPYFKCKNKGQVTAILNGNEKISPLDYILEHDSIKCRLILEHPDLMDVLE